jgi:hypothetical protein
MAVYSTVQDALTSGTGIERTFHCGNPDHNDKTASASVNAITGLFICYSCGWRGKVDVESFEIDVSEVGRQLSKLVDHLEARELTLTESWLSQYDAAGPGEYWLSRFTAPICREFRLGMDYEHNSATIPIRSLNGVPLGVILRRLDDTKPKYKYPFGMDISQYLFAYHKCTGDIIILTEGPTDTIAAWEVGFQAMAINGANLSKAQKDALIRYQPKGLILAFDMDEAGDRVARMVTSSFPEFHTYRPTWDGYKDLASMPLSERMFALSEAEKNILSRLAQPAPNALVYETCESHEARPQKTPSTCSSTNIVSPSTPRKKLRIRKTS